LLWCYYIQKEKKTDSVINADNREVVKSNDAEKDSRKQVKLFRRKINVWQKRNKDTPVKHLLMLPVHDVKLVPFLKINDSTSDVDEEIKVSDAMLQRIHKWSQ